MISYPHYFPFRENQVIVNTCTYIMNIQMIVQWESLFKVINYLLEQICVCQVFLHRCKLLKPISVPLNFHDYPVKVYPIR